MGSGRRIRKLLVANRSEIAIRVLRAANELGIRTVAVFSHEDRYALHRFKADEAYLVGKGRRPIDAYLDIEGIVRVARAARVDAVHPGYGFLSENPGFAEACVEAGLVFVGPNPRVMRLLGSKLEARRLASQAGLAVMPATGPLPREEGAMRRAAEAVGFPVMAKASWGGGGRGMRVIEHAGQLAEQVAAARREAGAAFGDDEIFLEKLIRRARHVEVQLIGDSHGNVVHLFERDCSMQRRNQKVVERAPAPYLEADAREALCNAAVRLARAAGYENAGTAEFLMDADTGETCFIEVNPRIQVEHTVSEEVTGVDIVKAQIRIAQDARIGDPSSGVPVQTGIRLNGHAVQCRITTEDPQNKFIPDYGRITAYRGANGFGIRLDGGTAYSGAVITPFYDSLLEKVTAWAPSADEAAARMDRALREFRIRGVATNLRFLEALIGHPDFRRGEVTTTFIDDTPSLFRFKPRRDRATRLLGFLGDVLINANRDVRGRRRPDDMPEPQLPELSAEPPPAGARQRLDRLGPDGFAQWMREQERTLMTDTTMRDAHQSLIATRMRSIDMLAVAPHYARLLPDLLSLECWGGATFDVAMRFLKEDPWDRLAALRDAVPNILLQALLRGANGVGYKNYPDNVVRFFVRRAAAAGTDLFRVFDCLNWVDNMRITMDTVREEGKLWRSGDLLQRRSVRPAEQVRLALLPPAGQGAGSGGRPHHRHQGHGGAVQAGGGTPARDRAQAGGRTAASLPHPRHQRHRRRERHRRRGGGLRCRRRRDGCVERPDLAAEPRGHRGGSAGQPPGPGARPRRHAPDQQLLGECSLRLWRLRERHAFGLRDGVRARDARRAVHQSARAGPRARSGEALAGGRACLHRGERALRRHHQGDTDLEGGRRPGVDDGEWRDLGRGGGGSRT